MTTITDDNNGSINDVVNNIGLPHTRVMRVFSYNCRGYNCITNGYVKSSMDKCDVFLMREHWLSEAQFLNLDSIDSNFLHHAVCGFDNSDVLLGRPYGGCAISFSHVEIVSVKTDVFVQFVFVRVHDVCFLYIFTIRK